MTLPRRKFLHLTASAVALPALSRVARADTYPSHPVRILVGFAAGSTTDILGRLIGQWLSQRLGQQFVVENKPGAGGNIAAEEMIKSTPDGYTLYMVPPAVAANAALYPHLNFVFLRDATAVAGVVRVPNVDMGGMALIGSPADYAKLIADETEKWGKVIRTLGIKAE
jgi:tripartite-type tricarboxylate transporter receptor subunit TctC